MKIYINAFGTEIRLKQEVSLRPASPALRDVLRALPDLEKEQLNRFINDDLSLKEGCVILVNGRNIASLDELETRVQDGDELTFTVLVAGGSTQAPMNKYQNPNKLQHPNPQSQTKLK